MTEQGDLTTIQKIENLGNSGKFKKTKSGG
jgi:hypothetical protein